MHSLVRSLLASRRSLLTALHAAALAIFCFTAATIVSSCADTDADLERANSQSLVLGETPAMDGGLDAGCSGNECIVIPEEFLPDEEPDAGDDVLDGPVVPGVGTVGVLDEPIYGTPEEVEAEAEASWRIQGGVEPRAGTVPKAASAGSSLIPPIDLPPVELPKFSWKIKTCANSPAPTAGESLELTVQSGGRALAWKLDNPNGVDRSPGATDTYLDSWRTDYIGPPENLESIKLDHRGGPWCVESIELYWISDLIWSWSKSDKQTGAFLSNHPTTGPITLGDDSITPGFLRFTNLQVKTDKEMCTEPGLGRAFYFNTCTPTNTDLKVEVKHDGLIDFIPLPKSVVDQSTDDAVLARQSWCALRQLEYLKISKPLGRNAWGVCKETNPYRPAVAYRSNILVLSDSPISNYILLWSDERTRTLNDSLSPGEGRDAVLTYDVNQTIDSCEGSRCVTAKQGFALKINSNHAKCASGRPPSTSSDATCNGVDDDCSGQADEDFAGAATTCGVGACMKTGRQQCVDGAIINGCTPGPRTGDDTDCDGIDDDCDGLRDEHWTSANATSCVGECRASAVCSDGRVTCGAPRPEIAGNGRDEDCDGTDSCSEDRQCAPGLSCIDGECRAPHCSNGIKDPEESGLDCGRACAECNGDWCEDTCRIGEPATPSATDALRFSRGAFVRSGTATFEPSPGRLEAARPNELRWINVDGHRMALFEGVSSNVLRWSSAFDHAPEWSAAPQTPMTVTADGVEAPDGTRTADLLRSPSGPSRGPMQSTSLMAGRWTLSLYVRNGTNDFVGSRLARVFAVRPDNTVVSTKDLPVFDDWGRLDLPIAPTATTSFSLGFSHVAGWPVSSTPALAAPDLATWGGQLEVRPFPTSYIPATSATVTRAADLLTVASNLVPTWLGAGLWQVEVKPEFSSSELITDWRHTLFSYDTTATNDIALVASPTAGRARLSIRFGTSTFSSPDLAWERGALLRLTFDMRAPAPGQPDRRGLTIAGAASGNGSYPILGLAHPRAGLRVGGVIRGTNEAFAAISEPRNILDVVEVCAADPSCTCGDHQLQNGEQCDPGLTAYCDGSCLPLEEPTPCEASSDCPNGQQCGIGNGRAFGRQFFESFCWPIGLCPQACGDLQAACGACSCEASCDDIVCGQRAVDACTGDICRATCDVGEPGCADNRDCPAGSLCLSTDNGGTECRKDPGYGIIDDGYLDPRDQGDGTTCLEGPACRDKCPEDCEGFCNLRGECLTDTNTDASCPPECPGACDTAGRCYEDGQPRVPETSRDPAPANGIGETKGAFSVADDGSARYVVPLAVAPARAGLSPQLALSYSSRGGDGPIGLGWSLSGVSAITLCDRDMTEDLVAASSGGPMLCLDGEPLRPLFAGTGSPTQSLNDEPFYYRTRRDQGYLVAGTVDTWSPQPGAPVQLATRLVPGSTFKVYTSDGRILTYGGGSAHLFRGALDPLLGPSDVRKWLLASMEDQYGNRVDYEYQKGFYDFRGPGHYFPADTAFRFDPTGTERPHLDAEVVLSRIAYNFDAAGQANSEVTFHYNQDKLASEDRATCEAQNNCAGRPSVHVRYWHGGPIANLLILDRIEVHTLGRLIRSYDLGQVSTTAGRVTLLDWLQECDYDHRGTTCLPELDFDYGNADPDEHEMGETQAATLNWERRDRPWQYQKPYTAVMDGDGDGTDDYFVFDNDGGLWMAPGSSGMSFREVVDRSAFPTFFKFNKTEGTNHKRHDLPFQVVANDWNKDGLSDLIIWGLDQNQFNDGENVVSRCTEDPGWLCGRNEGTGRLSADVPLGVWVYQARLEGTELHFDVRRILAEADMNGEQGLARAAGRDRPRGVHVDGSGRDGGRGTYARIKPFDYNRDGAMDFLYCASGDGDKGALAITTGAHLGQRWRNSFEAAAAPGDTPNFQTHALGGLHSDFCNDSIAVETRTDRTDLWNPLTHTVLTQLGRPVLFQETSFPGMDFSKFDLQLVELNGDDLPDILLHQRDDKDGEVHWWFNTGAGFFASQGVGFVPGESSITPNCAMRHLGAAVVSDFNNDGLDDLVLPTCAEGDRDRVGGMAIVYARRGKTGLVEFQSPDPIDSLVPSRCDNASSWAPKDSPYRAFAGDFDGDGDTDLRVLGEEWDNGVGDHHGEGPGGTPSDDICDRIPVQSRCCIEVVEDEEGFADFTHYDCYVNADAYNEQGECRREDAVGEYDRAAWRAFVLDVSNLTHRRRHTVDGAEYQTDSAWYLLSHVASTPVGGKAGNELTISYASGNAAEVWQDADDESGACSGLPAAAGKGPSRQGQLVDAPGAFDINNRRVYQRTRFGTACSVPGVGWCGARVGGSVVKGFSQRTSDNSGGWASCSDQRLFYENAHFNAWQGFVGFERIARVTRTGDELRSAHVEEYDLQPVPVRRHRLLDELVWSRSEEVGAVPVPTMLYPFARTPVTSRALERLPSGKVRESVDRSLLALVDVAATGGNSLPETLLAFSRSDLKEVRAIAPMDGSAWAGYRANWAGSTFLTEPLRIVEVVGESQLLEGGTPVSTAGTWTTVSPVGFKVEQLSWSSRAAGFENLRSNIPTLRTITQPGSTRFLRTDDASGWFDYGGHDALVFDSALQSHYVTSGSAPDWPSRQAFVDLPGAAESSAHARRDDEGVQDARQVAYTYFYDDHATLRWRNRETPDGEMLTVLFAPNEHGFIERVDEISDGLCGGSCGKTWTFKPDALGIFATEITNPEQQTSTFDYDYATGQVTSATMPDGVTERRTYDALGRLETVGYAGTRQLTRYRFEVVEPLTVATDDGLEPLPVRAIVASIEEDVDLARPTSPQTTTRNWFDASGRRVRAGFTGLKGEQVWTETEYDRKGRPVRSARPHVEVDTASQGTVRTQYDAVDRVTKVLAPSPSGTGDSWVEYTYGSLGDQVGATASWFGSGNASHADVVITTSSQTSHASSVKGFDAAGRLVTSAQSPASGAKAITRYTPGVSEAPTLVIGPDGDALTARYDSLGQQVAMADPESGAHGWTYDAFGRVREVRDNGTTHVFGYDNLDRRVVERVTRSDLGALEETFWDWDESEAAGISATTENLGKLVAVRRGDGFMERNTYLGMLNQLDSTTLTVPRPGPAASSIELVTGYQYDGQGRMEKIFYPALGRTQTLHYNSFATIHKVTSTGDGRGEQTIWELTEAYQGQFYQDVAVAGGRLREHRGYHAGSSSLNALESTLDGRLVQQDGFERDDLGRIVKRTMQGAPRPHVFRYDAFGRLEKRLEGEGADEAELESYSYSLGGRMERKTGASLSYTSPEEPNFSNAVKSVTRGTDSLGYRYVPSYGLMSRISGTWRSLPVDVELGYDAQRRLRSVSSAEDEVSFTYTPGGSRLSRLVTSSDEAGSFTVYAGKHYERTESVSGEVKHLFRLTDGAGSTVYEETVTERPQIEGPSTLDPPQGRILVRDYLGSVLDAPGDDEDDSGERTFDSFGGSNGRLEGTELGYTGHRDLAPGVDFGIELIDMGGRVYDPNAAQFLQPDPTFPSFGHPQGFNRRRYVRNDPVNLYDPTGFGDKEKPPNEGGSSGGGHLGDGTLAKRIGKTIPYNWRQNRAREKFNRHDKRKRGRAKERLKDGPFVPPQPSSAPLADAAPAAPAGPPANTDFPVDLYAEEPGLQLAAPDIRDMTPVLGPIRGFESSLNAGLDALLASKDTEASGMVRVGRGRAAVGNFMMAGVNAFFAVIDGLTWGGSGVVTVPARLSAQGGANQVRAVTTEAAVQQQARSALRDARGRFVSNPASPPSPYKFTDAQRRSEWRRLADDPNSGLTAAERAQVRERGYRGPQRVNEYGELETMELSHEPIPLRDGGTNVVPRWPADHAAVDPHRHLKSR